MGKKPETTPQERQAYGIRILKPADPELRRLKAAHKPSAQGYKVWNSTWLLLDHFERQGLDSATRVLDAGCGWGLAGIYCARRWLARVTSMDVDPEVFPFLHLHAEVNEVAVETVQAGFDGVSDALLEQQDLLIGADICFRDALVPALYQLVERAVQAGVRQIVLADPGRRSFTKLGTRCAQRLGAVVSDREVGEPLVAWAGAGVRVRGRVLVIGDPHLE